MILVTNSTELDPIKMAFETYPNLKQFWDSLIGKKISWFMWDLKIKEVNKSIVNRSVITWVNSIRHSLIANVTVEINGYIYDIPNYSSDF